jgi:FkbM family methyltransferase
MDNEKPTMDGRTPISGCWPVTLRDWFAAHSRVRLGRLDRLKIVRDVRRRLVRLLSRGGSSVKFDTQYGFQILLPASYRAMMDMALGGVLFHTTLVEVAREAIRPGDIVIDGGSNVGFFALLAATRLQGKGCVFAFEPDEESFSLVQENIRLNGFGDVIRAQRLALTDKEGTFDFAVNSEEPMLSSLVSGNSRSARLTRVSGVCLDNFLAASGLDRADIIKLDLEGAEPMALEGARTVLPTARMLIFEANEPQLQQLGVDPVGLVERTAAAGRFDSISFIDERSEKICRWEPRDFAEALSDYKFINVVCTRSSSIENRTTDPLRSAVPSTANEVSR